MFLVLVAMAALLLPGVSAAQAPMDRDEPGPEFAPVTELQKKKPGLLFHQPEMSDAKQQLAYAQQLLAAGRTRAARKQFLALVHEWHGSPEAAAAQLEYAKLLDKAGKSEEAFWEYQYLVKHFSGQFKYDDVLDRQFRLANTVMTERHGDFLFFPGFQAPEKALPMFEKIAENGPNWVRTPQAVFTTGLIHEEAGDFDKAIKAYERVALRYPKSDYRVDAVYRKAACLFRIAQASPRDEEACRNALSALTSFVYDHPESASIDEAKTHQDVLATRLAGMYFDRAVFYDRKARKPKAAVIAYRDFIRRFPLAEQAPAAKERLAELEPLLEETDEKL